MFIRHNAVKLTGLFLFFGFKDSKKDAEQAVNEEINGINDNAEEVNTCHSKGKPLGKRQRKRKNYGRDYELDQSEKETDEDERNEEGGKDHYIL